MVHFTKRAFVLFRLAKNFSEREYRLEWLFPGLTFNLFRITTRTKKKKSELKNPMLPSSVMTSTKRIADKTRKSEEDSKKK